MTLVELNVISALGLFLCSYCVCQNISNSTKASFCQLPNSEGLNISFDSCYSRRCEEELEEGGDLIPNSGVINISCNPGYINANIYNLSVCWDGIWNPYPRCQSVLFVHRRLKSRCPSYLFECVNTSKCIDSSLVCDDYDDCGDNTDEDELLCDGEMCTENNFRCSDRRCIPSTLYCDGENHCVDGSDEPDDCSRDKCIPNYFTCNNEKCVHITDVCNDIDDCGDNSDEGVRQACDCGRISIKDNEVAENKLDYSFPWNVHIFKKSNDLESSDFTFQCLGTTVREDLVMTAAACVSENAASAEVRNFRFVFGNAGTDFPVNGSSERIVIRVPDRFIIHPNYTASNNGHNIAVVSFSEKIHLFGDIQPACLDFDVEGMTDDYNNSSVKPSMFVSLSRHSEDDKIVGSAVKMNSVSIEECAIKHPFILGNSSADKICYKFAENVGNNIALDIGAGLLILRYKIWYLKGISISTKMTENCTNSEHHLFTNINHFVRSGWLPSLILSFPTPKPKVSQSNNSAVPLPTTLAPNPLPLGRRGHSSSNEFSCLLHPLPNGTTFTVRKCISPKCSFQIGDSVPEGTSLNFFCETGYQVAGNVKYSFCLHGSWTSHFPVCVPNTQPKCGSGTKKKRTIANGFEAKLGEYPWNVAVYQNRKGYMVQICGGTIISTKFVVTAAHCFKPYGNKIVKTDFRIVAGKFYLDWNAEEDGAQILELKNIHIPEGYKGRERFYTEDIALVETATDIVYKWNIQPVCMDWNKDKKDLQLVDDNDGLVVGWGYTDGRGIQSNKLLFAELSYINLTKCLKNVPPEFRSSITFDKFCAGKDTGVAVCPGDSGGGLVFQDDGRYYLQGIVSVGPQGEDTKCAVNYYAAFTDVSKHLSWIESFL